MNVKKIMCIALILFVAGVAVLFADPVASAFRDGYLRGFSAASTHPVDLSRVSGASIRANAEGAANRAGHVVPRPTPQSGARTLAERDEQARLRAEQERERAALQRLRDSYIAGYIQGWQDRTADRPNQFLW